MPLDAQTTQLLERYLDGAMSAQELAAFEIRLLREHELRAVVEGQRVIDLSLRRQFALPVRPTGEMIHLNGFAEHEDRGIAGRIQPATEFRPRSGVGSTWGRWIASIAAMILVTTGAWLAWMSLPPSRSSNAVVMLTPDLYYAQKTAHFDPFWKCDTNEQFASTFRNRFGQPLLLQPLPEDVTARGLDYTTLLSPQTMSVLMTKGDQKVIVLVDRADRDAKPPLQMPGGTSLHLHRQELGGLVLYEITPSPTTQMLQYFFNPDEQAPTSEGQWK